jgi:formylglycine-generating enzyme required for sulfatase activity
VTPLSLAEDRSASDVIKLDIGREHTLVFHRVSPAADSIDYPDFFVLETEVTNAQYKAYLDAQKKTKDDTEVVRIIAERRKSRRLSTADVSYSVEDEATIWREGSFPHGLDEHPVALVTLIDAKAFCKWLTKSHADAGCFRLPTWNEWMIAAYGKSRNYPWGDEWQTCCVHTSFGFKSSPIDNRRPKRTEPVKARPAGMTPEGLYGMLGNVGEYLTPDDASNDHYLNLGSRSMGGGFTDGAYLLDEKVDRIQPREDYWGYSHSQHARECDVGFRVVLDPNKNMEILKRPRIFEPRNRAWMVAPPEK